MARPRNQRAASATKATTSRASAKPRQNAAVPTAPEEVGQVQVLDRNDLDDEDDVDFSDGSAVQELVDDGFGNYESVATDVPSDEEAVDLVVTGIGEPRSPGEQARIDADAEQRQQDEIGLALASAQQDDMFSVPPPTAAPVNGERLFNFDEVQAMIDDAVSKTAMRFQQPVGALVPQQAQQVSNQPIIAEKPERTYKLRTIEDIGPVFYGALEIKMEKGKLYRVPESIYQYLRDRNLIHSMG